MPVSSFYQKAWGDADQSFVTFNSICWASSTIFNFKIITKKDASHVEAIAISYSIDFNQTFTAKCILIVQSLYSYFYYVSHSINSKYPRDGGTMNFVVYGQKETLLKRRHTNFQPKATIISLRLAGVRTKCCRKNGERGIPCSDKTFLFKEEDGCANQSRVGWSSQGHCTNVEDRLLLD